MCCVCVSVWMRTPTALQKQPIYVCLSCIYYVYKEAMCIRARWPALTCGVWRSSRKKIYERYGGGVGRTATMASAASSGSNSCSVFKFKLKCAGSAAMPRFLNGFFHHIMCGCTPSSLVTWQTNDILASLCAIFSFAANLLIFFLLRYPPLSCQFIFRTVFACTICDSKRSQ